MVSLGVQPAALVGDIYESACEPGHQRLMRALTRAIPGNSAVTLVADPLNGPVGEVYGLPQSVMQSYSTRYWKTDPWAEKAGWNWAGDQIFRGTDAVSPHQLMETRYYDEFAGPIGVVKLVTGMFSLGPATSAAISIHRSFRDPDFSSQECEAFRAVLPHIKRGLQLHRRLNGSLGASVGFAALDALAFGAVVCDHRGRIAFANQAAEELSHAGAGIRLEAHGVGLRAEAPEENQRLSLAITSAATGGSGGAVAIRGREGQQLHVLVAPLPQRLGDQRGLALVAFRLSESQSSLTEAAAIRLFNLTPAEARLAIGLMRGATLAELADQFRVSLNTLKTQLAQVTYKTGADSQRDLVRRLSLIPQLRQQETSGDVPGPADH